MFILHTRIILAISVEDLPEAGILPDLNYSRSLPFVTMDSEHTCYPHHVGKGSKSLPNGPRTPRGNAYGTLTVISIVNEH